jgi:hypothetical protein
VDLYLRAIECDVSDKRSICSLQIATNVLWPEVIVIIQGGLQRLGVELLHDCSTSIINEPKQPWHALSIQSYKILCLSLHVPKCLNT